MAEISGSSGRIGSLDGLRGIAALWVLIGHAMLLTGWHLPLIGDPDLGVDLFIMLSGFLMVFHYQLRQEKEPWSEISTWSNFWTRRFFRISGGTFPMSKLHSRMCPRSGTNLIMKMAK